ncbi:holo-ACP synthase [Candidatus Dependentiae bacterium]|nr:holo-ACP synthase [Candidatus Dependentiae bacterium]
MLKNPNFGTPGKEFSGHTILGIGIDAIEIERFKNWHLYSIKTLSKIFTKSEIEYCLSVKNLSAQRFASRFAAKEAAYKATSDLLTKTSFIQFCKFVEVQNCPSGRPGIVFKQSVLENIKIHLSITHTRSTSMAFVLLQKIA